MFNSGKILPACLLPFPPPKKGSIIFVVGKSPINIMEPIFV